MRIRRRRTVAVAVALAALVVAVLGTTPAGEAAVKKTVRLALFAKNAGAVNGIKASRKPRPGRLLALGANGRFPARVVPPGPPGPAGPAGPQGEPGAPATRLWAVVAADGTLVRASGATASANVGTGTFDVTFDRDVSACAFLAVPGAVEPAASPPTAQTTVGYGEAPEVVRVETETSSGSNADRSFHLAVFC